ncbi:hypothetical protein C8F01DRAFT_1126178 [Mycena amicta]|nr:hypothetical protein C8F01DRAFT_1126178 [Mycena amicta]
MAGGILDLSTEIVQEICAHLGIADQAALRAASKYLQLAVEPLLCAVIFIPSNRLRWAKTRRFLEALASGSTSWSAYGRILAICPAIADGKSDEVAETSSELLVAALWSCAGRVRTVRFAVSRDSPAWLYDTVCGAISAFPLLDDFDLRQADYTDLALPYLSGLSTLKITSATSPAPPQHLIAFGLQWRMLVVRPPAVPSQTLANQVAIEGIIACCANLRVLQLVGMHEWDAVWETLLHLPIHLTSLTINRVTPAILAYLKSYSGLESLVIHRNFHDRRSPAELDPLAREFFEEVLPLHQSTLKVLRCPVQYENEWSVGSNNVCAIGRMVNLTQLEMSVNKAAAVGESDSLRLFFQTILRLPHLEHLTLAAAFPEVHRASADWFARPNSYYERQMEEALRNCLHLLPDVALDKHRRAPANHPSAVDPRTVQDGEGRGQREMEMDGLGYNPRPRMDAWKRSPSRSVVWAAVVSPAAPLSIPYTGSVY